MLDPDVVAEQALALLTGSGVEGVTMARVARELGVTVRAIYHWVPSRAALLEAATLRAQESLPVPERTGDWRVDLRRHRDAMFTWLDTHPGVLDVHLVEGIAAAGPRVLAAHEAGLALFAGIGFAPARARLLYAEYANWVAATHHFHIRPHRRAAAHGGRRADHARRARRVRVRVAAGQHRGDARPARVRPAVPRRPVRTPVPPARTRVFRASRRVTVVPVTGWALLTTRGHIDLARVASALCRG